MATATKLVTVVVRDRDRVLRADRVDDWDAMTLVAALSADPRTFDELRRAYLRYRPEQSLDDWPWREGVGEPPHGGWMVLDLAALRLVAGGGAELPESPVAYEPDDAPEGAEDSEATPLVWVHLPPDWQTDDAADWDRALVALPVPHEPLDARGVLFGRPLAEAIAAATCSLAQQGRLPAEMPPTTDLDAPPSERKLQLIKRWQALTVRVHAQWLMTPRDDLEGHTPRDFLHRGRPWVEREMHYRETQWARERRAPRPLDRDTFAYRFGPLGRHEVVLYFGLCRVVIGHAWQRLLEDPAITSAALADALHRRAAQWLSERDPDDCDPLPPAHVIEHERRRLPLVVSGTPLDCDCPLCRMEAEGAFGPAFYTYDGYHLELDNEFAFSLAADRRQWQREQEEFCRQDDSLQDEALQDDSLQDEALQDDSLPSGSLPGASLPSVGDADADAVDAPSGEVPLGDIWQRSMVDWDAMSAPGMPAELRVLGIGMLVGELVEDLKERGAPRGVVDRLNAAFDGYRRAAGDPAMSEIAERTLAETLEHVADREGQLAAKAADLQSRLAELRMLARVG